MASRRLRIVVVIALILVIGLVVRGSLHGNVVTGTAGGRTLVAETAHVLSMARLEITESAAVVTLGDLRATVTADRVELPDGTAIAIPPDCARVDLRARDGVIEVKLDGAQAR